MQEYQEITTNQDKNKKKVKVDGFMYIVRRPGAGESMDMRRFGRKITALEKKDKTTDKEQEQYEELAEKVLVICISLFDADGNDKAESYLKTLAPETLMEVIGQVFGKATVSEPESPTTNA